MRDEAENRIQLWAEAINLWDISIFIIAMVMLIFALIKLFGSIRRFVGFVDTMQSLPGFIEITNRRFLVLFDHLNIDPGEADSDKYRDKDTHV